MHTDWSLFFGSFHPLIVHIPIGILLFAALLHSIAAYKKNKTLEFPPALPCWLGRWVPHWQQYPVIFFLLMADMMPAHYSGISGLALLLRSLVFVHGGLKEIKKRIFFF